MLSEKGLLLIYSVLISAVSLEAQRTVTPKEKRKSVLIQDRIFLRTGACYEKTFSREFGLAYGISSLYDQDSVHEGAIHGAVYSSFISRLSTCENRPVYGLRVGVEGSNLLMSEAIEFSYYWNNPYSKNMLVFTPKIGLNAMGLVGIYYGYNLYAKQSEFKSILGHHQISISSLIGARIVSRKFWSSSL